MEIVEIRCRTVLRALETLKESMDQAKEGSSTKFRKQLNDGLMQCFEYSIEEVWKLCGLYLQEIEKINLAKSNSEETGKIKPKSPRSKDVLRISEQCSLISQQEHEHLLLCIEDRNQTSHGYNFFIAVNILPRIPDHYKVMKTVVDRIHEKIISRN